MIYISGSQRVLKFCILEHFLELNTTQIMEIYEKVNIYFRICSGNLNTHNTSGFVHTIARSLGIGSAPKKVSFFWTPQRKRLQVYLRLGIILQIFIKLRNKYQVLVYYGQIISGRDRASFCSAWCLCVIVYFSAKVMAGVYSDLKLVLELLVVLLDLLTSPGSPRLRFQAGKRSFATRSLPNASSMTHSSAPESPLPSQLSTLCFSDSCSSRLPCPAPSAWRPCPSWRWWGQSP